MSVDIPIKYINETKETNFKVVVFSKNFSPSNVSSYFCAWRVLGGQSIIDFTYPVQTEVGATYIKHHKKVTSGPFPAEIGSTWKIMQESPTGPAVLTEDKMADRNPDNAIVIRNQPPSSWSGRKYDIGVYKDHQPIIIQKQVHTGNQVDFLLQPKLYFGVVRNMQIGETFSSMEITNALTMYDLSRYPNGIIVTLKETPDAGQFMFSAESMLDA